MTNQAAIKYMEKHNGYKSLAKISKLPQVIRAGHSKYSNGSRDVFSRHCTSYYRKWYRAQNPDTRTSLKDRERAIKWNKDNKERYQLIRAKFRWRKNLKQALKFGNDKRINQCKERIHHFEKLWRELSATP